MLRRMLRAMKYAAKEENFAAVLGAAILLILLGTVIYSLGEGWNVVDGFYFAVCTLTTSSIADPNLTLTHDSLKIFTAFYVLTGIGILVELARELGVGYVKEREERPPDTPGTTRKIRPRHSRRVARSHRAAAVRVAGRDDERERLTHASRPRRRERSQDGAGGLAMSFLVSAPHVAEVSASHPTLALLPDLGLRRIVKPKGNEEFWVFLGEDVVARVDLASHCHVWNLVEVAREAIQDLPHPALRLARIDALVLLVLLTSDCH